MSPRDLQEGCRCPSDNPSELDICSAKPATDLLSACRHSGLNLTEIKVLFHFRHPCSWHCRPFHIYYHGGSLFARSALPPLPP